MKTANSHGRIYGLDILRAFAILIVVYGHGGFMLDGHMDWRWYNLIDIDGVSIFFVLSGFLIGGILLRIISRTDFTRKDLWSFWVRRWFRTLPNYYLVLLLVIALKILHPDPHSAFPPPGGLWKYFLFLQNFRSPHPDFFPEAWSICVEECFYFIIPLLLFLSFRIRGVSRKHVFLFWITAIIISVTALRIYRVIHYHIEDMGVWDYHIRKEVITRLDSIMYGCLGAYLLFYHKELFYRFKKPLFIIGLVLLLTPNILFGFFAQHGWEIEYKNFLSIPLGSLGTLALLPQISMLRTGSGLLYRSISFIALISYSMYLLNLSVIIFHIMPWLNNVLGIGDNKQFPTAAAQYTIYWILSIGLAWLLYRFYERPMTLLREKVSRPEK